MLNKHHMWTVCIYCGQGTSLSSHQPFTSPIAFCLHILDSLHQMWDAFIGHSLHISHVTSTVECPNLSWLVHVSHLSSVWTTRIILDFQTLVTKHQDFSKPISFCLHIGQPNSSLSFHHNICPAQNRQPTSSWPTYIAFVLNTMVR